MITTLEEVINGKKEKVLVFTHKLEPSGVWKQVSFKADDYKEVIILNESYFRDSASPILCLAWDNHIRNVTVLRGFYE